MAKSKPDKSDPRPDLREIQDRLNDDEEFQQAFLERPVRVLRREGVPLTREAASQLRSMVRELGAPTAVVAAKPGIEIKISIGVKF